MTSYIRNVPADEAVCPNCGSALRQEMVRVSGVEENGRPMVRPGLYECTEGDFSNYNLPEVK